MAMVRAQKKMKPSPDPSLQPRSSDGVVLSMKKAGNQFLSRRWEELDEDCLTNVFAKVGMESLLLSVPFVCKSWYTTTLNPLCWKFLSFPDFEPYPLFTAPPCDDVVNLEFAADDICVEEFEPNTFGPFYDKLVQEYGIDRTRFSITAFVKSVVDRSHGKALYLKLPAFCTEEALRYVSDACPELKGLRLPDDLVIFKHSQIIPQVIGKWKFLKHLSLGGSMARIAMQYHKSGEYLCKNFEGLLSLENYDSPNSSTNLYEILVEIGIHCKHIRSLHVFDALVGEVEALTIATMLPNLVNLTLGQSQIQRDSLVMLLRGCKKLCCFHLAYCEGFEEGDEEMLKLASHISDFRCKGALSSFFTRFDVLKRIVLTMGLRNQVWRERKMILGKILG
ncbi:hypothetical protein M0R45_028776 [Rubus argutus]|uniref:F-box domain-containing protein n=1 Tax=Rubus argutus TaxID=59490 RepID=A0AAW1W8R8_RUBAR